MATLIEDKVEGPKTWLWVYIVCSIPVLLFYAAGLAGWFFNYPIVLVLVIFLILSIPLFLLLLKSPRAPQLNIKMIWIAAILITVRIVTGLLFQNDIDGLAPLSGQELVDKKNRLLGAMPILIGIVAFAIGWAIFWTSYFKRLI